MSETTNKGRVLHRRDDHVLSIIIDRPAKRNGFTPKMLRELAEAYTELERDPLARVGVLRAEGEHFTAGLDLPSLAPFMARGEDPIPHHLVDPFGTRAPYRTKPLVVAVRGICFTLGIELMLAADLVIAASDCRFAQVEVKRGIMPTGGATIRMVERAGWGNAMRYLLTGDEFDASTALRLGFVQEVVKPWHELRRALELAERIAVQAPLAVRATLANAKLALTDTAAAIDEFVPVQKRLLASADAAEGVKSFQEKRAARFTGN